MLQYYLVFKGRKLWYTLQCGWALRTLCQVKLDSHERANILWFLLYEVPRIVKIFPGSSAGKEFTYNAGDPGSIPESGRSPGEGKGYPLQYLAWRIPWKSMESQNRTQLSTFHFHGRSSSYSNLVGHSGVPSENNALCLFFYGMGLLPSY